MSLFESRLLAEGVRVVEKDSPSDLQLNAQENTAQSFESLVLERAKQKDNKLTISSLFSNFKKVNRNIYSLLAMLLFILGMLGVQKVLFTEQASSVNFFWAFALFFIPNFLMFFAWLFLFYKPDLLKNSNLTRLSLMLIKQFESRFNREASQQNDYRALFHCYFDIHFSSNLGRYQLSKLTHLLWFSYFTGATMMTIVMLATHQVDFVWQTSILSTTTFQELTQLLSYIPQKIGFPVPSIEQIQHSHLGAESIIDAENRRLAWSSLLISSLLLYGLLPRLLLLLFVCKKFNQKTEQFQLDFSKLYYVKLRQLLKPNKTTLGISDADDELIPVSDNKPSDKTMEPDERRLPVSYSAIAIELSSRQVGFAQQHQHLHNHHQSTELINVCDHQAQQYLLAKLKEDKSEPIVLYVALNRLPDRGLKRFIGELASLADKGIYLLLIVEDIQLQSQRRTSDWYQLANDVGIALDNILHIEVKGKSDE